MDGAKVFTANNGTDFYIRIDDIKPSDRLPDKHFRVLWSVSTESGIMHASFSVNFDDALLSEGGVVVTYNRDENTVTSKDEVTEFLMAHVVIDETWFDGHMNHTIEFYFANEPSGKGAFDGYIMWDPGIGFMSL